jgi:hypothetical protein
MTAYEFQFSNPAIAPETVIQQESFLAPALLSRTEKDSS